MNTTIKLLLSTAVFLLSFSSLQATEETKRIKASLKDATVFFNGAELTHKASSAVTKGSNNVWISEISPHVEANSLKISTTKGVLIASHEFSLDYINQKSVSPIEKVLKDSAQYYKDAISEFKINTTTNNDLLELLKANKSIGGSQTGLNITELAKMVEYYKVQSNTLNRAQNELGEKTKKAEEALGRINAQLKQESAKNTKSVGLLKLNVTSPITTTAEFTITYFTKSANWIPYYDINVAGTDEQIQIASKAKVAQTTGLEWENVKLALSTTTPSANKEAPLFTAWFLDFKQSYPNISMDNALSGRVAGVQLSQNTYSRFNKPAIAIRGAQLTKDNNELLYVVNGEPISADDFADISSDMIEKVEVLKDANATSLYGSRGANGVIVVTTKSLNDFVDRSEGELSTVYNIDLPYTISGNGKVQNIDLQSHTVSAEFKYYATPKLESDVFVLAEISDWQKLGLLSGKANVTFDGTYVGETTINASSIAKNLTLTLGTDKRVTVKRERLQDYSSTKTFSKDVQQDFTYKLTVKNNRNSSIKMVLKDQYPLSMQKDIQIELLKETTPATATNEEVGVLHWEFDLAAGQSNEYRVAYRVKYPKDKNLTW